MLTKIRLLALLFFILFGLVIVKLFYLQIFSPHSSNINLYLKTKKIEPERGRIFDRNFEPLVLNQNAYLLYLEPKKIENKKELIEKLSLVLGIEKASLEAKIDENKYWQLITNNLDEEKKKSIELFKLSGIGFEKKMRRYYPEASLSAHLLGFVGKNITGDDVGYFGIEGYYNEDLTGLPGLLESERDIIDKPIFFGKQEKVAPENGRDLILTIDKNVTEIAKRKLKKGIESYKAKKGCVIIADPSTMAILSLVCLPDYDPANYSQFSEDFFRNPVISDLYEPGSTFKPLIMAAAINEKKIQPDDFYNENGPLKIGGYMIETWDEKYEGKISMTRILEKSSNVGMVYVGEKLGHNNLYQYLKNYGFGQLTSIDLQGEVSGSLRPKDNWYPIDYATVTFGQGIAVTPIQMIRAFASLVNNGLILKPYVVEKIVSQNKTKKIAPKIERKIISERTSAVIKKMLISTVENGEIKWAKPKGYTIGGKTGTAQIAIKGYYHPQKTIASFIGFAPGIKPRFIILVALWEPETSPWGSETAAPLFFEILKELLVYYNIPPE